MLSGQFVIFMKFGVITLTPVIQEEDRDQLES